MAAVARYEEFVWLMLGVVRIVPLIHTAQRPLLSFPVETKQKSHFRA